jgi:hypothetical protein
VAEQGDSSAVLNSLLAVAGAGENFFAWLKSRKPALADDCPKKITVHEAAVKSGENAFCRRGVFSWHRRC